MENISLTNSKNGTIFHIQTQRTLKKEQGLSNHLFSVNKGKFMAIIIKDRNEFIAFKAPESALCVAEPEKIASGVIREILDSDEDNIRKTLRAWVYEQRREAEIERGLARQGRAA